jgi:hypothetical protein
MVNTTLRPSTARQQPAGRPSALLGLCTGAQPITQATEDSPRKRCALTYLLYLCVHLSSYAWLWLGHCCGQARHVDWARCSGLQGWLVESHAISMTRASHQAASAIEGTAAASCCRDCIQHSLSGGCGVLAMLVPHNPHVQVQAHSHTATSDYAQKQQALCSCTYLERAGRAACLHVLRKGATLQGPDVLAYS